MNIITGIPNSAYRFQTLGNAVSFISGLIAALLYGNIGVKVFYSAVLRDVFRLPPLSTKTGKWLWVGLGKYIFTSRPGNLGTRSAASEGPLTRIG